MKSERIIVLLKCKKCFFLRKLIKMSNLIICFSKFLKFFLCVRVRQITFFYLRTEKSCLSEAVSSVRFPLQRWARGKHIENIRDQMCLSFSTRSPLQSMADLYRCQGILSHYSFQIRHYQRSGLNTYQFVSLFQ